MVEEGEDRFCFLLLLFEHIPCFVSLKETFLITIFHCYLQLFEMK